MARNQIVITTATVTVFSWSAVMAAVGEAAAIVPLAPLLGFTIHQIVRGTCPRSETSSGHCVPPVPDKEDRAA
ncbi:hypothetical protein ACFXPZ_42255 [Streptomyces sp. NPDC059101]|uniref:hypothetical protein n=1 Tax=Streptomyces sp. NPDC059101 TaxID=3346728 RepID=UPI00368F959C